MVSFLFYEVGDGGTRKAVKKTVRWTVFRCEVRSGYAARTQDARRSRCGCIPPGGPKQNGHLMGVRFVFSRFDYSNPRKRFAFSQILRQHGGMTAISAQNRGSESLRLRYSLVYAIIRSEVIDDEKNE